MAAPSLSALTPITTTASTLSNLILVSPQSTIGYQPQNPPDPTGALSTAQPPPAFLFNYEGEQSAQIESDITDHFIQNNTALQDQIALKPVIINTHGFIGELNNVVPPLLAPLQLAANKLTIISAYTPALSTSALIAFNAAFQLYQTAQNAINAGVATWSSINGTGGESVINGNFTSPVAKQPNQTAQQLAYQQLYGYWAARTLFTIQTPWAIFTNMAIKSMRAIQSAEDKYMTDFEMSFKQIRIATTAVGGATVGDNQAGRATLQSANETNIGTSTPVSSTSLPSALSSSYGLA